MTTHTMTIDVTAYRVNVDGSLPEEAELVRVVRTYDPDDPRYRKIARDDWREGNRRFAYDELKLGKKVPVFCVLVPIEGIMDKHTAATEAESMLIAWLKEQQ